MSMRRADFALLLIRATKWDDAPSDWKATRTLPDIRDSSRGGLMLPLEDGRWMVTLGGRHGDKPPGDPDA